MLRTVRRLGASLAFVVALAAVSGPALADAVRLQLKGGGLEVEGDLVSFDGTKYVLNSAVYGEITVESSRFDCISPTCPTVSVAKVPLLANLAATADGAPAEVSMAGSNTIGNALMPSLIESYAEEQGLEATRVVGASGDPLDLDFKLKDGQGREVAIVHLHRHGSGTSFEELEKGTVEIGMSSRRIKDKEITALAAKGLGNMLDPSHEHVIGLDGLLVIVAPENPVAALSLDTITKIFAGTIKDWSEVGQPPGKIQVYAPTEQSGTFQTFDDLMLKPAKVKLTEDAKRSENHAQQSDWVAADPKGIGFVGVAYQRNTKALDVELACGLKAKPSRFSIKTEEYPLSRRLYLYTAGTPRSPLANGLLQFALSDKAQPMITATDFIDQQPERLTFKDNAARVSYALNAKDEEFDPKDMSALVGEIQKAERLSSTLRFEFASFNLDTKAVRDIGRLARILAEPTNKGRTVLILGFADGVGPYATNLALSRKRAETVEAALRKAGFAGAVTKGFGELAPVACNDTDQNRALNRRVEVWLK